MHLNVIFYVCHTVSAKRRRLVYFPGNFIRRKCLDNVTLNKSISQLFDFSLLPRHGYWHLYMGEAEQGCAKSHNSLTCLAFIRILIKMQNQKKFSEIFFPLLPHSQEESTTIDQLKCSTFWHLDILQCFDQNFDQIWKSLCEKKCLEKCLCETKIYWNAQKSRTNTRGST